jgi:hypothetical protein
VSNFLSTLDNTPAETELLFIPLAVTETITEDEFDGIDFCYDSNLILSADQVVQITQFRDGLRSCKSDKDKFQLCMDTRDNLVRKVVLTALLQVLKLLYRRNARTIRKEASLLKRIGRFGNG